MLCAGKLPARRAALELLWAFLMPFLKAVPFTICLVLCPNFPGKTSPKFMGIKFFTKGSG